MTAGTGESIERAEFSAVEAEGLVERARRAGVTIRPTDAIYRVSGVAALACVRTVRPGHLRLCGCFVGEENRGQGWGRALVLRRLVAIFHGGARMVDTYAFRPALFLSLGFEAVRDYKVGTTLLRLRLPATNASGLVLASPALRLIGASAEAAVYHGNHAGARFVAEMIACDPPWRQGNLSYWSHQAGVSQRWDEFVASMCQHFAAPLVYLKVGSPEAPQWAESLRAAGHRVATWATRYSSGVNAQVLGCRSADPDSCRKPPESKAAATAVADWAAGLGIRTVADPCVGLGVMLDKFRRSGMRVVGVELVEARARRAAELLCKGGD
jgi:hypothetical protein